MPADARARSLAVVALGCLLVTGRVTDGAIRLARCIETAAESLLAASFPASISLATVG